MDRTKDFLQKNLSLVYSIIVLAGVVFGWYDNFKTMEFEIQKYNEKFEKQEVQIENINNQLRDYNLLQYKVIKIDENVNIINKKIDDFLQMNKQ